jgi:hypothetical protein
LEKCLTVVVAGAGPGIGSAVAKKFAAEGFQVTGAPPIIMKKIGAFLYFQNRKLKSRVADPHQFNADPDQSFHFKTDPDPSFSL